jgi:hypothetical protein
MPRKASKTRKTRSGTAASWFDSFPPVDPAGWDDSEGWCRRHWAPIAAIPDPAQRALAMRLASLELMVSFAALLRREVDPLPVPARYLQTLVRHFAPVCCRVGDETMQGIALAAILSAGAVDAAIEGAP